MSQVATEPKTFTKKTVAEYLGYSETTIKRLIDAGKIPFYRPTYRYKFRKSSIDKWLEEQEKEGVNYYE